MKTMTKTAGKTATSKSVANAKAGKAVRTLSLQQQLIKAERDLKNIVNRQLGETVLHAQELIVKQLKQAIEEKNSKALTLKDEPITFQLTKTEEKVSKKIAFVKHNRSIDSKKVDGLETIRKIREKEMSMAVLFMSRSDEYYREAFDLFAYNYLLKPVTEETLEYVMKPLKKLLCNGSDDRVIHFQYRARVYTVRYSQVSYIASSLHIVNFHKTDGSILQCRGKLKDFEKQLDDSTFLRCHQSFIVNMERVTGAENDSFHIGEHVIPISRSYNRNAHEKYEEYLRLQQEYDEEEED